MGRGVWTDVQGMCPGVRRRSGGTARLDVARDGPDKA